MSNPTKSELFCTASEELEAEIQKELEETGKGDGEAEAEAIEENICEITNIRN